MTDWWLAWRGDFDGRGFVSPMYRGTTSELSGEVVLPLPVVDERERWFEGADV